jgi:ribosomal protein S18 acetylase RimI-like enzyme
MDTQSLLIRPYCEAEEAEVISLWLSVFPDEPPWNAPVLVIRRKVSLQRDLFLVGEFRDRVVATVLAGFDGFRGWVYHLAVAPEHRRQGFGRAMMQEVEARLRLLGCPKLNLQVRTTNAEVIEFYRRIGYQVEDRVSLGKRLE